MFLNYQSPRFVKTEYYWAIQEKYFQKQRTVGEGLDFPKLPF